MNALQLNDLEDINEFSERERFALLSIDQVNWAFRKLAALKAKKAEIEQLASAEIARINVWKDAENRKLEDGYAFFEALLSEYALRQRDKEPGFKKESTPYGTVKFRKQQPKWNYDDATLLESLKSSGLADLIRIKEEPNKVEIKKVAIVKDGKVIDPESGVIIDGVTVEDQPDAITVEVSV